MGGFLKGGKKTPLLRKEGLGVVDFNVGQGVVDFNVGLGWVEGSPR